MENCSNEELIELYRMEKNEFVKETIREYFFRKNEKMPYYIANKFKRSSVAFDDLASIAGVGMLKAFEKFNTEVGVKFISFASRVMTNEILIQFRKEKKHEKNTSLEGVLKVDAQGNEFSLADVLTDGSCFEEDVEQAYMLQLVKNTAVHVLSDTEYIILFNSLRNQPFSQRELADQLNFSQSYVSRIFLRAAEKVKKCIGELQTSAEELANLNEIIKAEIGDIVEWPYDAELKVRAEVIAVHENAAVVDFKKMMPNYRELGLKERTVVKHVRYKILGGTTVMEHKIVDAIQIVPGSLENYRALKAEGYSDSKIVKAWDAADETSKWHTARFYAWKKEHALVKGKEKPEDVTDLTIKASDEDAEIFKEELAKVPAVILAPETIEVLPDAELLAEIEQLKAELVKTRAELWSERTARLFTMQAELDALICESNGLQIADYDTEHILATIVELAEVAQEEQSFKYWKKNKQVDREKLLEETADVLHFIISRGLQRGIHYVSIDVDTDFDESEETVTELMLHIIDLLLKYRRLIVDDAVYPALFRSYFLLVSMLGFEWAEITAAYEKKHSENIARQNRNY